MAVSAAESAYNRIADIEDEQKMRTQGLSTSGSTATVYTASGGWVGRALGGKLVCWCWCWCLLGVRCVSWVEKRVTQAGVLDDGGGRVVKLRLAGITV